MKPLLLAAVIVVVGLGYAVLIWLWKGVIDLADQDEAALRQVREHPRAFYAGGHE